VHVSAELRDDHRRQEYTRPFPADDVRSRGFFVAGSYRLNEFVEVGAYTSHYVWHVKVEGHFVDGHGQLATAWARSFYRRDNANPDAATRMVIVRTGLSF
jgi:hypothetical protein